MIICRMVQADTYGLSIMRAYGDKKGTFWGPLVNFTLGYS